MYICKHYFYINPAPACSVTATIGAFFNAYSGMILGGGALGLGLSPRRPCRMASSVVFTGVTDLRFVGVVDLGSVGVKDLRFVDVADLRVVGVAVLALVGVPGLTLVGVQGRLKEGIAKGD